MARLKASLAEMRMRVERIRSAATDHHGTVGTLTVLRQEGIDPVGKIAETCASFRVLAEAVRSAYERRASGRWRN